MERLRGKIIGDGGPPRKRRPRLMLVDDDADITGLYEFVADVPDTIFTIQNGGLSALRFLNNLNYDVDAVILDLSMPDMDGITLTAQIRRQEHLRSMVDRPDENPERGIEESVAPDATIKRYPIAIFWFTGWNFDPKDPNDPVTSAAREYKVTKVYQKPLDPVDLIKDVRQVLEKGNNSLTAGSSGE